MIFPATLTDIFTGLHTALGVEYTILVAAEMVASTAGLGWLVLDEEMRIIEEKIACWKDKD